VVDPTWTSAVGGIPPTAFVVWTVTDRVLPCSAVPIPEAGVRACWSMQFATVFAPSESLGRSRRRYFA